MFQKMKDLYKMQKQAKAIKKELKQIHIEAEENGVVVVVTAEQDIVDIQIPDELLNSDNKGKLQKSLISAMKKAMKKSQTIAAEKMKVVMGDMGLGM
jgi:DNA-binding protein YbaB